MENTEVMKLEEVLEEHGEHKEPESSLQHIVQRPKQGQLPPENI